MSEGTVELKGWIPRDIDKRFREFVAQKYGIFIRGHFSYEIAQALIYYMDVKSQDNRAHTHKVLAVGESKERLAPSNGSTKRAEKLIEEISTYVMKKYDRQEPPSDIGYDILERAIITIENIQDKRSIKARVKLLTANGMLKWVGDKLYEIPYNKTERITPSPPVEQSQQTE